MMEKLKKRKFRIAGALGVVIAGVFLSQGIVPKEAQEPKIAFISSVQGLAGTEVIITGSGFKTSAQGIVGTKVKEHVLDPGNYILMKDEVISPPLLSPDGKTLTIRLDLVSGKVKRECEEKFGKKNPEPCKVPIKVVNAYGKPSNDVHFTFTGREIKKLLYTVTKLPMPMPAIVHARRTIGGYSQPPDEVMRIRVSAAATNERSIDDIVFSLTATGIPTDFRSADDIRCVDSYLAGDVTSKTVDNMEANIVDINTTNDSDGMPAQSVNSYIPLYAGVQTGRCVFSVYLGKPLAPGTQQDYSLRIYYMAIPHANPTTFYLALHSFGVLQDESYVIENKSIPYIYTNQYLMPHFEFLFSDLIKINFQQQ